MSKRPRPRNAFSEPDVRPVTVFIYGLAEPGTWNVRYIGRSSSPLSRVSSHLSETAAHHVKLWATRLKAVGQKPQLMILRVVRPGGDAALAELETIRDFEARGFDLLNYHGKRFPGSWSDHQERYVRELIAREKASAA